MKLSNIDFAFLKSSLGNVLDDKAKLKELDFDTFSYDTNFLDITKKNIIRQINTIEIKKEQFNDNKTIKDEVKEISPTTWLDENSTNQTKNDLASTSINPKMFYGFKNFKVNHKIHLMITNLIANWVYSFSFISLILGLIFYGMNSFDAIVSIYSINWIIELAVSGGLMVICYIYWLSIDTILKKLNKDVMNYDIKWWLNKMLVWQLVPFYNIIQSINFLGYLNIFKETNTSFDLGLDIDYNEIFLG